MADDSGGPGCLQSDGAARYLQRQTRQRGHGAELHAIRLLWIDVFVYHADVPIQDLVGPLARRAACLRLALAVAVALALAFEIERDGRADQILQRRRVELVALVDVDG